MARKANVEVEVEVEAAVEVKAAVEESGHGQKRKKKTKKKNSLYHKGVPPLPCEKEKRKYDSTIENKVIFILLACLFTFTFTLLLPVLPGST